MLFRSIAPDHHGCTILAFIAASRGVQPRLPPERPRLTADTDDLMSNGRTTLADRLTAAATTLLGAILAATPAALWIAWSTKVLIVVVAVAIASAGLFVLLTELRHPSAGRSPAADGRALLPDEFIAEVHELFPLTYHHSRLETTRFRRAMERLSRMINAS